MLTINKQQERHQAIAYNVGYPNRFLQTLTNIACRKLETTIRSPISDMRSHQQENWDSELLSLQRSTKQAFKTEISLPHVPREFPFGKGTFSELSDRISLGSHTQSQASKQMSRMPHSPFLTSTRDLVRTVSSSTCMPWRNPFIEKQNSHQSWFGYVC